MRVSPFPVRRDELRLITGKRPARPPYHPPSLVKGLARRQLLPRAHMHTLRTHTHKRAFTHTRPIQSPRTVVHAIQVLPGRRRRTADVAALAGTTTSESICATAAAEGLYCGSNNHKLSQRRADAYLRGWRALCRQQGQLKSIPG